MPLKPGDFERLLQSKYGFTQATNRSSDHRAYQRQLAGLPVITTKVSHNKKEIGAKLEGIIAKQLRVRKEFFRGMMACNHDLSAYEAQVRSDPYPPWDVTL